MKPRWHHGVCAALAVVLVAALVVVLLQAPEYDEPAYFEDMARLQQIRQLDAQWELDVMKARLAMLRDYDVLVAPLQDMARLPQQLHPCPGNAPLAASVAAYRLALDGKTALVESFKSHNAVLRNSLLFMVTLAVDAERYAQRTTAHSVQAGRNALAMREVALDTLEYIELAAEGDLAEIDRHLAALAAARSGMDAAMWRTVDNFALHVRIVLREHAVLDRLLSEITDAPTEQRLDQIHALLADELRQASQRVRQHRQYLLVLAVALSGLLLYAAVCRLRNHAIIKRYNVRLQQANDTLEGRVQERTQQLEDAQSQLLAVARAAGKAEIATNVLHNVGNVLNSVGVSAALLQQQVQTPRSAGLDMAVALMREQGDALGHFLEHDERGRCLPEYLAGLAQALRAERNSMACELSRLHDSVDHVKEIVAAQQAYAGAACMFEQCEVADVIDQAVNMSAVSLSRHGVAVVKDYVALPPLLLDRHRVLQILVNLISNAGRAMDDDVPECAHRITLRLRRLGDTVLQIEVADNGGGILPENLACIFTHGFTTRKDGHGFGLHSCVLAARDMGGSLCAQSAGTGHGATFTLELPVRQEEYHEFA